MLNKYKNMQTIFYNYIMTSFSNDKISHAYLIETNGVNYAYDLAIDLAKFFLCDGVYDEGICKLVDAGNYYGFRVIGDNNEIKKEEILSLKKGFSLKSYDNRKMVYLIKDASLLNKSSANTLLKFLEEPEEGIVAILVADRVDDVIDTIVSRCQIVNLVNDSKFDYKDIFKEYYNEEFGDFSCFVENEFSNFLNFYMSFEKNGVSCLAVNNCYDYNNKISYLLKFGLYFYFDILNVLLGRDVESFLPAYNDFEWVVEKNEIDDIIYKIDVINEFLFKSKYNVNANLFMDNFIICLGGN